MQRPPGRAPSHDNHCIFILIMLLLYDNTNQSAIAVIYDFLHGILEF